MSTIVDAAYRIAERTPMRAGDIMGLLRWVRYPEEYYGTMTKVSEVILFLSNRGYDAFQIQQVMEISIREFGDITTILDRRLLNVEVNKQGETLGPRFKAKTVDELKKEKIERAVKRAEEKVDDALDSLAYSFRQGSKAGEALGESYQAIGKGAIQFSVKCKFRNEFGGDRCGYKKKSSDETCDGSFGACKNRFENEMNFGGFQSIPNIPETTKLFTTMGTAISTINRGGEIKKIWTDETEIYRDDVKPDDDRWNDDRWNINDKGEWGTDQKKNKKFKGDFDIDLSYSYKDELKRPKEIEASEWRTLSTNTKKIILKSLGYNIEEKETENKNRAIDL